MGVIDWRLGRMVEGKLVQGKTQTVKTVLPVTVREARREQTNLALVARAGTLAAYTILLLGLLAVLATLCNYRNTRIENRKLQMEVRKSGEEGGVGEMFPVLVAERTTCRSSQLHGIRLGTFPRHRASGGGGGDHLVLLLPSACRV